MSARAFLAVALLLLGTGPAPAREPPQPRNETLSLAAAAARGGNWAMAARLYRDATRANGSDAAAWAGLGSALVEQGEAADALAALTRAHVLAAATRGLARQRGRAEIALGRAAEAQASFAAATTETPDDPRAWTGLGVALDLQSRHAQALQAYDRALTLDPLNLAARTDRALSWALTGRIAEAAAALRPLAATPGATPRLHANLTLVSAAARP